jgi:hypothetical protein
MLLFWSILYLLHPTRSPVEGWCFAILPAQNAVPRPVAVLVMKEGSRVGDITSVHA